MNHKVSHSKIVTKKRLPCKKSGSSDFRICAVSNRRSLHRDFFQKIKNSDVIERKREKDPKSCVIYLPKLTGATVYVKLGFLVRVSMQTTYPKIKTDLIFCKPKCTFVLDQQLGKS